jgi:hypothetical protein
MSKAKMLNDRQKELQSLLATPAGRTELEALADRCATATGRIRPPRTSVITYILVHERATGLILNQARSRRWIAARTGEELEIPGGFWCLWK